MGITPTAKDLAASRERDELTALIYRATHGDLVALCRYSHIPCKQTDSKEVLRSKLLKGAFGPSVEVKERAVIPPAVMTEDERAILVRQAVTDEIELLQATADSLRGLLHMGLTSYNLASQAESEIRYCAGKTNIAKLVTISKGRNG